MTRVRVGADVDEEIAEVVEGETATAVSSVSGNPVTRVSGAPTGVSDPGSRRYRSTDVTLET
jgi:hypothetical protein